MRKFLELAAILAFAAGSPASHAEVTFNLDTVISGSTPSGSAPWLTATFANGAADQVVLTLTNNMGSGLYITDLLFNTSLGVPSSLLFAPSSYTGTPSISNDQTKAGSPTSLQAGLFNIDVPFTGLVKFDNTTPVFLEISAAGLTENSFNVLSAPGGTGFLGTSYLMAAGVQDFSNGSSSSIGFTSVSAVPEPEIYAMLGFGLALMAFLVRRKGEMQRCAAN